MTSLAAQLACPAAAAAPSLTLARSGAERVQAEDPQFSELMRAAQKGDGAAYGRLLGLATPVIRRAVSRRWSGPDAEDIVQEVLLSVHAVRHTYDPARPFLPWLAAITARRVADCARRHARRAARETPENAFPHGLPEVAAPEPAEGPGDTQLLGRALAELPEGQRRAIQMVKMEDRPLREVAEATGMSIGALKVAVHRGIKALRARLVGRDES